MFTGGAVAPKGLLLPRFYERTTYTPAGSEHENSIDKEEDIVYY